MNKYNNSYNNVTSNNEFYGYNDNNFGRQHFPSNVYPNRQNNTGNYQDRFNSMTPNTLKNFTNLDESFMENKSVINRPNYENKGNVLHNNIGDSILDEHVVEYKVNIDSIDRDIFYYKDPFKYTVRFDPSGKSKTHNDILLNNKKSFLKPGEKEDLEKTFEEHYFDSEPMPHISMNFRNVKYVKLESIILPVSKNIIFDEEENEYKFDHENKMTDDRFVTLSIDELMNERTFSTFETTNRINPDTGKIIYSNCKQNFAKILPDKIFKTYYSGLPYYGNKIYKNSQLGNIDKMTINFIDSFGQPLRYDNLLSYEEILKAKGDNNPVSMSDARHPLNKKIQNNITLLIGVVESQINTNTNYFK